jgi:DNA-binding transcriptional ArsR family regulator
MKKAKVTQPKVPAKTHVSANLRMMEGPRIEDFSLCKILYALSDPTRMEILRMIDQAGGELRCGFFSERIGLSKPTLSHHLGILRESGVVETRMEGTHKLNAIRHESLQERFPGLLKAILGSFS